MSDDVFRIVITVAVALAAIAFLVQAGVVLALYGIVSKLQKKVNPLMEKAGPVIEKVGPLVVVVSVGNTRVRVVRVARTASAGVVPSTRKASTWCRWGR